MCDRELAARVREVFVKLVDEHNLFSFLAVVVDLRA